MIGLRDDLDSALPPPAESRAPELAAKIFAENGWLHRGLALEHRPQQEHMAHAVAAALRDDAPLLFEAGTGVGKSLAYLVPGIIQAVDQSRQLIVSTHTISLQEQLNTKDLPICRRLFASAPELKPYVDFKSTVFVGKSNYLCTTRLGHALADRASLFADADYDELQRIAAWAETTDTGLRHDLQPPPRPEIWDAVNADSSLCSRKHCDCEKCFYQRARARTRSAHVIIINHALLFALINAGGAQAHGAAATARGVLFADDFLVLDEAHTVPEVATNHFGLSLSSYGVDRSLKYLFNPRTQRGLFRKLGGPEAQQLVLDALDAARQFYEFIAATLLAPRAVVRVREPGVAEPLLDGPLGALHRLLAKLSDQLEDGRERERGHHGDPQRRADELGRRRVGPGVAGNLPDGQPDGEAGHREDREDPPAGGRIDPERVRQSRPDAVLDDAGEFVHRPQRERADHADHERRDAREEQGAHGRGRPLRLGGGHRRPLPALRSG